MSGPGLAVPPGRSGRLWLQRRLETARRGASLLDRKLRILQAQLDQARDAAAQTAVEWRHRQAEAESWLLRAALLGGQRAIRLADDGLFAEVTVSYAATMGIRYPAGATCVIPPSSCLGWPGAGRSAAGAPRGARRGRPARGGRRG